MTQRLCAALLGGLSVLASFPVAAHEEFLLVGTIAQQQFPSIQILTTDGRRISVRLDVITRVWRDKARIAITGLKTGEKVDVRAYGDSEEDLLALEVTIMPPGGAPAR